MIVVTANRVSGKRVVRTLGLVRGNTIRARHIGKDIMAVFRNIVGGEVAEYTKLLAESRYRRWTGWWTRPAAWGPTPSSRCVSRRR